MPAGDVAEFYDGLADDYHLIFADWDASIRRQGTVIDRLLKGHGSGVRRVLDGSCGIGTQALGLAVAGYDVTACDISARSVERCAREAATRGLQVETRIADLRRLDRDVDGQFDCVVTFDNALPHLLEDDELADACGALRGVLRSGGLLCASIRDYDAILADRPTGDLPRLLGDEDGERVAFQVWDWSGDLYTVRHFLLDRVEGGWNVSERRTTYRALRRAELSACLLRAGFDDVAWLMPDESGFYQPIVIALAPRS